MVELRSARSSGSRRSPIAWSRARDGGNRIVVVVSAMAGETNRLFKLASELSESPNARETDVLVATGEQVSAALLAIRLQCDGASDGFVSRVIR